MVGVLTEIGVPLATLRELSESRTPETVIKLLTSHREKIACEIDFLHDVLAVIDTFIDLLNEGISVTESEISVSKMSEKRLILGGENSFSEPGDFFDEFVRFRKTPCDPQMNISYPVGGFWPSMPAFTDHPSSPARFFSLNPKGKDKRNAGMYLNGYTRGYYGQTGDLPERMMSFAKEKGLRFTGPVYVTYLFDEISISDPNQYLAQISAAVAEKLCKVPRRPHRR
jgi:hypothetical protein